ncbi:hypothetical protein N7448_009372 [Penicillium atrosanguineum]|uniref:Sister chromatid cohesion protein Dcc1 n=1 Tax=Penicillium atrosanguineum TaxID=1132637 RepID=A0A9W9U5Q8_9EURO|nr:uncharacterized protein N7443_006624 [Penicillium atrosanguineum]KAJ5123275.1 hypothetical protein N7448_009372 [Penicillium atrosanguineum]KAJ5141906.1 hypothetical protein N7526_002901 [Penicillium atrosanguineum]KAJ5298504.1 hypothetical protein N7443_006624 [Penicillium atrosanguineum]KAJ5321232.1 hypothetical protein N7476_004234 [Penicillium atrosanguineum]
MATQGTPSILFTNTQPQQSFRLLEIPPELEDLFTSKDAPALELKSPSTALAHAVADAGGQEYVNLCTPTQTYRIRQVMSSNSLHIVRPSEGQISKADIKIVEDEVGESGTLNLPDEAVTAIAKCGSTLELHVPPGGFSAVPFLEKSLGLYDRRPGDDDGDIAMDESGELKLGGIQKLRDQVCMDIPVSAAQCETGWVEICAFVDERMKVCWRPSSRMRVNVWKRMMEGALLQGIDLEKQFLVGDLWKAVLDDDESEPFPRGLLEGVVRRLCVPDERPALADEIKWASFDKAEVTKWLGETYLASIAPTASSAVGRSEFLRAWKDCLPESWRSEATLSKLPEGCYKSPDPTSIFYVEPSQRQHVSKASTAASSTAAKAKTSRNWHELLKNSSRR